MDDQQGYKYILSELLGKQGQGYFRQVIVLGYRDNLLHLKYMNPTVKIK